MAPERALWIAVLVRALRDLHLRPTSRAHEDAKRLLGDPGDGRLPALCAAAGLEVGVVRRAGLVVLGELSTRSPEGRDRTEPGEPATAGELWAGSGPS